MKPVTFSHPITLFIILVLSSTCFAQGTAYPTSYLMDETTRLEKDIQSCKQNIAKYDPAYMRELREFKPATYARYKHDLEMFKNCLTDAQEKYNLYKKELNKRLGTPATSVHEKEQKKQLGELRERSRLMQVNLNELHNQLKELSAKFEEIPEPEKSPKK